MDIDSFPRVSREAQRERAAARDARERQRRREEERYPLSNMGMSELGTHGYLVHYRVNGKDPRLARPYKICREFSCVTRETLERMAATKQVVAIKPSQQEEWHYDATQVRDIVVRFRRQQLKSSVPDPSARLFRDPDVIRGVELSRLLDVTVQTVRNWGRQGFIAFATRDHRRRYYNVHSVREFLQNQTYEDRARKRRRTTKNVSVV